VYGLYPEVVNKPTQEEKQDKLRDILESTLYKDIFMLERMRSQQVLVRLVALLAIRSANLVNIQ